MAIQITRWHPDTCSCVIDYQWDSTLDPTLRVHSAATIISQCSYHAGLALAAHFTTLMDENPRKNQTIDTILKQVTTLTDNDITWSLDINRVLNITCPKLTISQKNSLQTAVNTKFGVGKVLFL